MTISADEIHQLIKSGQNPRTDWSVEGAPIPDIAATLTAMANYQGGRFLMGVAEEITGVTNAEATIDRVLEAALSIDPPLILPLPKTVQVEDKTVVIVDVPQGMPYVYALDGRYLSREEARNTPLNPRDLRRLLIERGAISFETEIAQGVGLEDIDWTKVRAYATGLGGISEVGIEPLLVKRGCLVPYNGKLCPTNAGILLFGKDPQRFLRGAEITAVRFAGEAMGDTFSRQDIVGTLPDQIRRAETFLLDHLRKGVQLTRTMERHESFEYPMEAARELVVNAVAHRDYSISGDGIRLFIFSNRMEVNSPGGLPGPVTIDNIKDERFSRNPAIVQVLSDMGFIERLGYGVDRVIELMSQQELREPEFMERAGSFRVILYNQAGIHEAAEPAKPKEPAKLEFHGVYQGMEINPRQETALIYLHEEGNARITNSDLQTLCPDVHPETIRRDLADLVTKNILNKLGQKRGSYYVLKND